MSGLSRPPKILVEPLAVAALERGQLFEIARLRTSPCSDESSRSASDGQLSSIDEAQADAIRQRGADLFHKVESEGHATGAIAVQEAHPRIEAMRLACRTRVQSGEDVEEGENCVPCGHTPPRR